MEKPRHGGHLIAEVLKNEGVRFFFTLSGGHIAPIYDGCLDMGIDVVDFRHEQSAAHAADGWARLTLDVGAAGVTAGPGLTDAVTGIANAYYANSPVIYLSGKPPLAEFEMGSLQEMDHVSVVSSITKWARTCFETKALGEHAATAIRHALAGRPGPVFLDVPLNVQADMARDAEAPRASRTTARPLGDPDFVRRAAELLREARHPVVFAGSGVRWAGAHEQLRQLAATYRVPIFLNSLGRGCLPPDDPHFFSMARRHALESCDVLLGLGVDWDFRLGYGRKGFNPEVKVVQVDVDAAHIGRNRPVDVGIVGDPGKVIEQLLAEGIGRTEEPQWTEELRGEEDRRKAKAQEGMDSDAVPIHPQRFAREIRDFLDPDAVVIGDGGDIVGHTAAIVHARYPGHWMDPGPLGTLGVGPGFAVAARLAKPDKQVLVVYGDGAFGLNAMEYDTAIRHRLPFVGIIGNDRAWGQTKVVQQYMYGNTPAAELGDTPYEKMVEALGGYGERVEKPTEIGPALQRAFDSGVPACLNVPIDSSLIMRAPYL